MESAYTKNLGGNVNVVFSLENVFDDVQPARPLRFSRSCVYLQCGSSTVVLLVHKDDCFMHRHVEPDDVLLRNL